MVDERYDDYINPKAGDNILIGLGNNNAPLCDSLAEFIDNSLAARINNYVEVDIRIEVSILDKSKNKIIISDCASGMSRYKLEKCLSLGETPERVELNEHGFGIQNGIFSLGGAATITTKTKEDTQARQCKVTHIIKKTGIRHIKGWNKDHGTTIEISDIKTSRIFFRKEDYTKTKNLLGARYRYYLVGKEYTPKNLSDWVPPYLPYANPVLRINFSFINLDSPTLSSSEYIHPTFPLYYHPETKENKPYVEKIGFFADDGSWEAYLTAGYAPSSITAKKKGINLQNKDPYGLRPGFDLIIHNRVIKMASPDDIGIDRPDGTSWLRPRGEIHCLRGFKTIITKNDIVEDKCFKELKQKIKEYFNKQNIGYYKIATRETPEKEICDRIVSIFRSMPTTKKVDKGYHINDPCYPIDISLTTTDDKKYVYEVKVTDAGMLEVLQVFGYIKIYKDHEKTGFIIARKLTEDGKKMIDALQEDGYSIVFLPLSSYCPEEYN